MTKFGKLAELTVWTSQYVGQLGNQINNAIYSLRLNLKTSRQSWTDTPPAEGEHKHVPRIFCGKKKLKQLIKTENSQLISCLSSCYPNAILSTVSFKAANRISYIVRVQCTQYIQSKLRTRIVTSARHTKLKCRNPKVIELHPTFCQSDQRERERERERERN